MPLISTLSSLKRKGGEKKATKTGHERAGRGWDGTSKED